MEYTLTLANTEVRTIAIRARHASTGERVGHAPGNGFSVRNSDPAAISAMIVTNVAGNPALRLQPIVDEADGVEIDVFDTAGSRQVELTVNVVARNFAAELELDMDNSSTEQQGKPSEAVVKPTPGPNETQPVASTGPIDPGVAVGGPAVVGPEKSDAPAATAEPGAATQPNAAAQTGIAQPGAETQPGVARQEPAGSVSDQEAEKERIAREQAANKEAPGARPAA